MVVVKLSRGMEAIIDADDLDNISHCSWSFDGRYAQANIPGEKIYMHRVISGAKSGQLVDHMNQNKLDNRKENLRIASRSENAFNSTRKKKAKSGHVGVSKNGTGWLARIAVSGRTRYLGTYRTIEEAVSRRKLAECPYR